MSIPSSRTPCASAAVALCAALGALPLAQAQSTATPAAATAASELDPVVITGSKGAESFGEKSGIPLSRMPQSVQLIQSEEITRSGAQSVGELLRGIPSANAGNSRVARYQSFSLKIRGFLADQMRNGMRQRYYEDIDASALANVERIEVLKGPSSVLYGQSAIGGILSVITKRPEARFGAEGWLTVGSHEQRLAGVDLTGPLTEDGRLSARFTAEIERSGTFVDFQDIDRDNAALALRWAATPGVTVHFLGEYTERRTLGNPGLPVIGTVQPNGVADIPLGRFLGEPSLQGLSARAPLVQLWADVDLGAGWTLTPRYQYQPFRSAFSQVRVRAMEADGRTLNRNGRYGREDDVYQIAQLDLGGTLRTGGFTHKLLAGLEASREKSTFLQDTITNVGPIDVLQPVYTYPAITPARSFAFDFAGRARGTALYVQDLLALTNDWDIVAGLRHSRLAYHQSNRDGSGTVADDSTVSATTWQLASNLRLDAAWTLFGGVNTGFDVESTLGARAADGSPLKPERSDQVEAGLRYAHDGLRGSAALFQVRRKDAMTTDPANPDFSVQTGEQRVRGLELEGEAELARGWSVSGGYARLLGKVTRSNDGDEGTTLGDTPRHTLTLGSRWALPDTNWVLRGGVSAVSSRLLVNGSPVVLPRYALLDLGLGYRVGTVSVDLSIHNATDKRYFTATGNSFGVYPGDPRQVSLRVGIAL